jgi:hypothetical protein
LDVLRQTKKNWQDAGASIAALFISHANPKYFLFHPSHRIFRCMREALNVGKKDN